MDRSRARDSAQVRAKARSSTYPRASRSATTASATSAGAPRRRRRASRSRRVQGFRARRSSATARACATSSVRLAAGRMRNAVTGESGRGIARPSGPVREGLEPDRVTDPRLHLGQELRVVLEELPGVVAPLTDALIAVREPRAALLDDAMLHGEVEDVRLPGDPLAVHH